MSEHLNRFGQLIRNAREAADLSREEVAEKAGIGFAYYGQIERGLRWPRLEKIVKIANAIGVSPSVFLELDPAPTEPDALRAAVTQQLLNRNTAQLQVAFRLVRAILSGPAL
jgi:transcriptional regulator with XRE-family HTH domain